MKKNKTGFSLIFIFLLSLSTFSFGQTAEQIINQHLENSGGIKNWRGLNSIILKGNATLSLEQSFPIVIYHRRPYEKRVDYIINGKPLLSEGYDGKNGWTYNEISQKNEIINDYIPESFESDMLDYQRKGFEAEFIGLDEIDGKECYKVVLTKHTNQITYCFSTKDYSLLSEENKNEKLLYYDYKTFGGLQFATRTIGQPKEGGEYLIQFTEILINPTIDNKKFKF